MLRSAPSFSIYSDGTQEDEDLLLKNGEALERTATIGDRVLEAAPAGSGEFSFARHSSMVLIDEEGEEDGDKHDENLKGVKSPSIEEQVEERQKIEWKGSENLGLGGEEEKGKRSDRIGVLRFEEDEKQERGLKENNNLSVGEHEQEEETLNGIRNLEVKKLVLLQEDEEIEPPPSPPMYIAAGLGIEGYGFGGDGAETDLPNFEESVDLEEYYKRMVDEYPLHPSMLKNYAQILESKGDLQGAEDYYHRCTLAEPGDGEILAQYAQLVWKLYSDKSKAAHYFALAVQAAPQDCNVLAAHARFLWDIDEGDDEKGYVNGLEGTKLKVDNDGLEGKDSCTTLANSGNGETICKYAKTIWDINRDHKEASFYFQKAAQASPEDSDVLAAYARFLWETEEDDEEEEEQSNAMPKQVAAQTVSY